MKHIARLTFAFLSLFLIALPLVAADGAPAVPADSAATSYGVYFGGGFNQFADPKHSLWGSLWTRIGDTKNFNVTSFVMPITGTATKNKSYLLTGFARELVHSGRYRLYALSDFGIATEQDNVGGTFTFGGAGKLDTSDWFHLANSGFIVQIKRLKATIGDLQPVLEYGFGKEF